MAHRLILLLCLTVLSAAGRASAQTGACCTPDNECTDGTEQSACMMELKGIWQGDASTCADGCPDCDCDGISDFAVITECVAECVYNSWPPRDCQAECDADDDGVPNACQDGSQDPDSDGDIAACDNCPGAPNPDQEDSDEDGVGDACGSCEKDGDCDDRDICTDDACIELTCWFTPVHCPDGLFCNDITGECVECMHSWDCGEQTACVMPDCNHETGRCFGTLVDCPLGTLCDDETGDCVVPRCDNDEECDDGIFCNGVELCGSEEMCQPGEDQCIDSKLPFCDVVADACVECQADEHCDDEDSCTENKCVDGMCSFPTIICENRRRCVGPNGRCVFCSDAPAGMCCDPRDGSMTALDDGDGCTQDRCNEEGEAVHLDGGPPPLVEAIGPHRIRITMPASEFDEPVALVVTSPDYDCLHRYVGLDGLLVDSPIYREVGQWAEVVVDDRALMPGSASQPVTISVQSECGDGRRSRSGSAITSYWGDVNADARVDLLDITCVLDGFVGDFSRPECPFEAVDLSSCMGDGVIDLQDILSVLDAFTGNPPPCGDPCAE